MPTQTTSSGRCPNRKMSSYQKLFVAWIILSLFVISTGTVFGGDVYAIKGATIIPVTSDTIKSGTIILRGGIIDDVGQSVTIPPDAMVIEAESLIIYPGLIDAHTNLCMPVPKEKKEDGESARNQDTGEAFAPERFSWKLLKPTKELLEKRFGMGITTALSVPDKGIFIGQSTLINLGDTEPAHMVLKPVVAMHLGYTSQKEYPNTLMAIIAYQKQCFYNAQHHKNLWDRYNQIKRGIKRPEPNESLDALIPVLERNLPVIITANEENEIRRAVKLARQFGLEYMISGATEGWRVVDVLKAENKPVLLSMNYPKPEDVTGYSYLLEVEGPAKEEKKESKKDDAAKEKSKDEEKIPEIFKNAAILYKAGIHFAFTSFGMKKTEDFLKNIKKAIAHDLPADAALRALTIQPARIFGVAEQTGSIEAGKIANLVITDGDIFDENTTVKYVFIDGKKMDLQEKKKPEKKKNAEKRKDEDFSY